MLGPTLYLSAGSIHSGIGHLCRSQEIIALLRNRGANVCAVGLLGNDDEIRKLSDTMVEYDVLETSISNLSVRDTIGAVVDVDVALQPEIREWLENHHLKAVGLDWYSDPGRTIVEAINMRGGRDALKYCIVRREFREIRRRSRSRAKLYDVVVSLGGGDTGEIVLKVVNKLAGSGILRGRTVAVMNGPFVSSGEFDSLVKDLGIHFFYNVDSPALIMGNATVGISNGGSTLMEFAYMGVPVIVLPRTDAERMFADSFVQAGCARMGEDNGEDVCALVRDLLDDPDEQRAMFDAGCALVDGKGSERIVGIIGNVLWRKNEGKGS